MATPASAFLTYNALQMRDFRRFHPCAHISVPMYVPIQEQLESVCALCCAVHDGQSLEALINKPQLRIEIDDDHPYCGPHTIMRFYCAQSRKHRDECVCARADLLPGKTGCKPGPCSQYFYATIHDFQTFTGSTTRELAGCWNAHVSDLRPIYKCLVAMELTTGIRFDYPIHVQDGLRAGYNPHLHAAIVCAQHNSERDVQAIHHAFPQNMPKICVIDPSVVNDHWKGTLPPNRCDPFAAASVVARIITLASIIARQFGIADKVTEFSDDHERVARLENKVRAGRLLTSADIDTDDRAPVAPRHDINKTQFITGSSGPLVLPPNDPYERATSCIAELLDLRDAGTFRAQKRESQRARFRADH